MNPFRMAAANVMALRRRLVGLTVLVALAVAICMGALSIADRAQAAATGGVEQSDANRSITVERAGDDHPGAPKLTERTERTLAALPHAQSVQHRAQVSFGYSTADNTLLLYATTYRSALAPPVTKSVRKQLFPLHAGEVVLPASSQGSTLDSVLGKRITVETTRFVRAGEGTGQEDHLTVVGLFDPSWQMDNPDAAYVDDATVVRWAAAKSGLQVKNYLGEEGYDQLTVVADSAGNVPALMKRIQGMGLPAVTLQQQLSALPAVLDLIRTVGKVLLVILAVLAFAGAVTSTGALARQRSREIGILKAVGFRTRAVLTLLVTEMALVGAVAAVVGALLGMVLGSVAAVGLRSSAELAPYLKDRVLLPTAGTTTLLLSLAVVVVAAGALMPARRAARMSPTEAIKDW
ncbi:ABC transporter permease [Streptomyces sp. NBC_00846]|uniref:ABC transporter permease n=1 Tax=Streptomyces sp. NBC_00846 TaxID=2975849 RepID=UPI00386CE729|nr:ABC transporter permease [Streptomyces sp. NBC_00846]